MYPQESTIAEVRRLLEASFERGFAVPPVSIVAGTCEDDEERAELHSEFVGKTWWSLPYEVLLRNCDAIPLFSIDGFSYYTPAFLCACLDLSRPEAYDMCSSVLMSLNPIAEDGQLVRFKCARLNAFSPTQRASICKFVSLFLDVEGLPGSQARASFAGFWEKALP